MTPNKSILLIPHFNNPEGLYVSLKSIGTKENIDVIIIDDGSKTEFSETVCSEKYSANGKLFFISLPENKGIEIAMNAGLDFAKKQRYEYVARLDCGDINTSDRFKIQEDYLENHPEISIVGSHSNFVDMEGKILFTQRNPLKPEEIKKKLFFNSTFVHPTIMFRTSILELVSGYPTEYPSAEDYGMYMALNKKGVKMANIDQVLLDTEANPDGISLSRRKTQLQSRLRLIWKYAYIGYYPIMGLIRNSIIYLTPYSLLLSIKKQFRR